MEVRCLRRVWQHGDLYANNPEFVRRFEIEAQLIARLDHIHIVPLYDYWREPNNAYLVMRWLRGGVPHSQGKEGAPVKDGTPYDSTVSWV
jgi:serine/threonine protein kinase